MRKLLLGVSAVGGLLWTQFLWAQDPDVLQLELEETKEALTALEARVEEMAGARSRTAPGGGSRSFNPEIGLVADIIAFTSESNADVEGNDKISVRELELIFGADIDPYSRFDATLTYSDFEDFEIEEAYITHYGIPLEIKGRLGRVRPIVGKSNPIHLDQQDTSDYPLPVQEYLGVDGWFRTGLELSRLFSPFSDAWTHELIGGLVEGGVGEGGTMFGDTRRNPTLYARLKNFRDVSESTSLELGANWLQGSSSSEEDLDVTALVGDLTLIHRFDAIRRFKLQSELWWQDREQPASAEDAHAHEEEHEAEVEMPEEEGPTAFRTNPVGLYVLGDLRLSSRWGVGGRYDYVEPINIEGEGGEDQAGTAYVAFYQSEFFRWRLQYQHVDFAEGGDDHRVWLQATIAIGVHQHALQ